MPRITVGLFYGAVELDPICCDNTGKYYMTTADVLKLVYSGERIEAPVPLVFNARACSLHFT